MNGNPGASTEWIEGGKRAVLTVEGEANVHVLHIDIENATTSAGYMLIDLSDTTFPHTETGHADIYSMHFNLNPDASFAGDVEFGFISEAGTADSDFNIFYTEHMDRKQEHVTQSIEMRHGPMELDGWIGPTSANDDVFTTGGALPGPAGGTHGVANGDVCLKLVITAGAIDVGLTLEYDTHISD